MNKIIKEPKYHNNESIDSKMFIDYNLLENVDYFNCEKAIERFNDFMFEVIRTYEMRNISKLEVMFSHFTELSFFPKIGFGSQEKSYGKGVSAEKFITVLKVLSDRNALNSVTLSPIFNTVFIENYGPDSTSDTLISLFLPELSEFTENISQLEPDIRTREVSAYCWDLDLHEWKERNILVVNTNDDNPDDFRLLCPSDILTTRIDYTMDNFINGFYKEIFNAQIVKNGDKPYTLKQYKKYIKDNFGSNHNFLLYILSDISTSQLNDFDKKSKYRSRLNKKNEDPHL